MRKSKLWIVALASCGSFVLPYGYGQQLKPDKVFLAWDEDKSGTLTKDELPPALKANFQSADADGDGFISPAEHARFRGKNLQSQRGRASEKVELHTDLAYANTENPRQKLDLLLPKNPAVADALPVIAFIHGGGWKNGDKGGGIRKINRFVESGRFAGVSIGYRLSGEAQWPAQIHDCKAAIRWLKGNAMKYNIDPERICVFGTSAGGHLVAMLGVTGDVVELEGDLGSHTDQNSRVAAVVDFFGPTDFLTMNDFPGKLNHNAANSPESQLIGGAIQSNQQKAKAAAPITYVTDDDAPILIMHGTKDPLVPFDQSVQFHKALTLTGVKAILIPVTDGGHGFGGKAINERVDQFIESCLLGKDVVISKEPIRP